MLAPAPTMADLEPFWNGREHGTLGDGRSSVSSRSDVKLGPQFSVIGDVEAAYRLAATWREGLVVIGHGQLAIGRQGNADLTPQKSAGREISTPAEQGIIARSARQVSRLPPLPLG